MVPEVTISSGAVQSNTSIYNLFKDLKVTAAHNAACIYPEAKIYYIFGDTQLDDKTFDKSKATLVGEDPIVVIKRRISVNPQLCHSRRQRDMLGSRHLSVQKIESIKVQQCRSAP